MVSAELARRVLAPFIPLLSRSLNSAANLVLINDPWEEIVAWILSSNPSINEYSCLYKAVALLMSSFWLLEAPLV